MKLQASTCRFYYGSEVEVLGSEVEVLGSEVEVLGGESGDVPGSVGGEAPQVHQVLQDVVFLP